MRITVFGSSSKDTPKKYVDAAYELGQLIASHGYTCTNGGGAFGVMGSLSAGARSKGGRVIGIIHEKFCVDGGEDNNISDLVISHGADLTERKQLLYDNGDCIICLPGGTGTFDEICESILAKSLDMKGLSKKPICLVNIDGYYDGLNQQMKRASDENLLYLPLEKFYYIANTPKEALEWCVSAYKSAIGAKLEDLSVSRKSVKHRSDSLPVDTTTTRSKSAISALESSDPVKVDTNFKTVPVIPEDESKSKNMIIKQVSPLVYLTVGVIIGLTLAKRL